MRYVFLICIFFYCGISFGNMGSPMQFGSKISTAVSSRDIDILYERILIRLDEKFESAKYIIDYKVKSEISGNQIPLLFVAKDFKDEFTVLVNNTKVELKQIPYGSYSLKNTPFEKFLNSFKKRTDWETIDHILISWEPGESFYESPSDMKYFEIDLPIGIHYIHIEYNAIPWINHDLVNEYTFRYSLSPAKFWKSFGGLEVTLDATSFKEPISTNFSVPSNGNVDSIATWKFSKLPGEFIQITFNPRVNFVARALIFIEPMMLSIILILPLLFYHLKLIIRAREKNSTRRFKKILYGGVILVPILWYIVYAYLHDVFDLIIGEHAGKFHDHVFYSIVLIPLIYPVYIAVFIIVDWFNRRRLAKMGKSW